MQLLAATVVRNMTAAQPRRRARTRAIATDDFGRERLAATAWSPLTTFIGGAKGGWSARLAIVVSCGQNAQLALELEAATVHYCKYVLSIYDSWSCTRLKSPLAVKQ